MASPLATGDAGGYLHDLLQSLKEEIPDDLPVDMPTVDDRAEMRTSPAEYVQSLIDALDWDFHEDQDLDHVLLGQTSIDGPDDLSSCEPHAVEAFLPGSNASEGCVEDSHSKDSDDVTSLVSESSQEELDRSKTVRSERNFVALVPRPTGNAETITPFREIANLTTAEALTLYQSKRLIGKAYTALCCALLFTGTSLSASFFGLSTAGIPRTTALVCVALAAVSIGVYWHATSKLNSRADQLLQSGELSRLN